MKIRIVGVIAILIAIVCLNYRAAWSQAETGSISGTVSDQSGAIVPQATVTATNVATGIVRTVQTGSEGQYVLPELSPGVYNVNVTSNGFAAFKASAEVTICESDVYRPSKYLHDAHGGRASVFQHAELLLAR